MPWLDPGQKNHRTIPQGKNIRKIFRAGKKYNFQDSSQKPTLKFLGAKHSGFFDFALVLLQYLKFVSDVVVASFS